MPSVEGGAPGRVAGPLTCLSRTESWSDAGWGGQCGGRTCPRRRAGCSFLSPRMSVHPGMPRRLRQAGEDCASWPEAGVSPEPPETSSLWDVPAGQACVCVATTGRPGFVGGESEAPALKCRHATSEPSPVPAAGPFCSGTGFSRWKLLRRVAPTAEPQAVT